MFPRREGWVPKFKKGTYSEYQQRPSSFRAIKPSNRSFSANEDHYYRKRQKPHVLAGMFANAKSSVPVAPESQPQITLRNHPEVSKAYSDSSKRVSKFCNFPRAELTESWDFTDVSSNSDKSAHIPSPRRSNSDEEHPETEKVPTKSPSLKKPVVPWLRKLDSADETSASLKPKIVEEIEYPDSFEETIDRFSSRLDQIGALPTISLQNHTETTMGKVEKALITVALAQTKEKDCKQSLPLYDLLVERSDWLIFQEEFNDDKDYLPNDPFYTHDAVSSEFEEYVQEQEAANESSYTKMMSSASQKEAEDVKQESPKKPFSLFEESPDLDSQEDFFGLNLPSTSQKKPRLAERQKSNFPIFNEFRSASSTTSHVEKKRKVSSEQFTPRPSLPTKRRIQTNSSSNVPVPHLSSEFSPFNFEMLSGSSPPSPKKSQPPSKYTIW